MLKPQADLEKMSPNDASIYALNIFSRYENCPHDLDLCLVDFASSHIIIKAVHVTVESEDLENYTLPVSDFFESRSKNGFGEMKKCSYPCVIRFHKVSKTKRPWTVVLGSVTAMHSLGDKKKTSNTEIEHMKVSTKKLKMR